MMTSTDPHRMPLNPALLNSLRQRLGDRLSTSAAVREQHGKDESYHAPHAARRGRVRAKHRGSRGDRRGSAPQYKTPVIAFGAGTSLEGHVAALHGGICIDLSRMNRILRGQRRGSRRHGRGRASRASSSTSICATRACSFRSIPAPMPRSAAWRRRAPRAPTRCATARCARTCCR